MDISLEGYNSSNIYGYHANYAMKVIVSKNKIIVQDSRTYFFVLKKLL